MFNVTFWGIFKPCGVMYLLNSLNLFNILNPLNTLYLNLLYLSVFQVSFVFFDSFDPFCTFCTNLFYLFVLIHLWNFFAPTFLYHLLPFIPLALTFLYLSFFVIFHSFNQSFLPILMLVLKCVNIFKSWLCRYVPPRATGCPQGIPMVHGKS